MTTQHLTDAIVKRLPAPATGNKIFWDDTVAGFGVRVTAGGTRSFILNYRNRGGTDRRCTIGGTDAWKTSPAREKARELKRRVDDGLDPQGETQAERDAHTVAEMCERFEEQHFPKLRPSTQRDYKATIRHDILPNLGTKKLHEVKLSDVDALHRKITKRGATIRANMAHAVLRRMFNLAIKPWEWCTENPCKGLERNQDNDPHERYLSGTELVRFLDALSKHEAEDKQAVDIIRMLLLVGARRGEVQAARWKGFDLETGHWTKPSAQTKQKKMHRIPLNGPARLLLTALRAEAEAAAKKERCAVSEFVFPSDLSECGYRVEYKRDWIAICASAGMMKQKVDKKTGKPVTKRDENGKMVPVMVPNARVHDLRHNFASVLVSGGQSLPIIGRMLGHTRPETTRRYSHLMDDPLRQATETAGAFLSGKPSAEIVPLGKKTG